jgi:uncharacterized protein YpmS
MKTIYFVAICIVINLFSNDKTKAQSSTTQKDKLMELISSFIGAYNTGDSIEYKNWFVNSGLNKTEIENAVKKATLTLITILER